MSKPYNSAFEDARSPLATPSSPAISQGGPTSYKTNIHRNKTKRWVEAPKVDYGGGWGDDDEDDEDEYGGGYDDYSDTSRAPPPPPPQIPAQNQEPPVPALKKKNSFERGDEERLMSPAVVEATRTAGLGLPPTPEQMEQREREMQYERAMHQQQSQQQKEYSQPASPVNFDAPRNAGGAVEADAQHVPGSREWSQPEQNIVRPPSVQDKPLPPLVQSQNQAVAPDAPSLSPPPRVLSPVQLDKPTPPLPQFEDTGLETISERSDSTPSSPRSAQAKVQQSRISYDDYSGYGMSPAPQLHMSPAQPPTQPAAAERIPSPPLAQSNNQETQHQIYSQPPYQELLRATAPSPAPSSASSHRKQVPTQVSTATPPPQTTVPVQYQPPTTQTQSQQPPMVDYEEYNYSSPLPQQAPAPSQMAPQRPVIAPPAPFKRSVVGESTASSPTTDGKRPIIRPSDIYKRHQEELRRRASEDSIALSMDSGAARPSIDSQRSQQSQQGPRQFSPEPRLQGQDRLEDLRQRSVSAQSGPAPRQGNDSPRSFSQGDRAERLRSEERNPSPYISAATALPMVPSSPVVPQHSMDVPQVYPQHSIAPPQAYAQHSMDVPNVQSTPGESTWGDDILAGYTDTPPETKKPEYFHRQDSYTLGAGPNTQSKPEGLQNMVEGAFNRQDTLLVTPDSTHSTYRDDTISPILPAPPVPPKNENDTWKMPSTPTPPAEEVHQLNLQKSRSPSPNVPREGAKRLSSQSIVTPPVMTMGITPAVEETTPSSTHSQDSPGDELSSFLGELVRANSPNPGSRPNSGPATPTAPIKKVPQGPRNQLNIPDTAPTSRQSVGLFSIYDSYWDEEAEDVTAPPPLQEKSPMRVSPAQGLQEAIKAPPPPAPEHPPNHTAPSQVVALEPALEKSEPPTPASAADTPDSELLAMFSIGSKFLNRRESVRASASKEPTPQVSIVDMKSVSEESELATPVKSKAVGPESDGIEAIAGPTVEPKLKSANEPEESEFALDILKEFSRPQTLMLKETMRMPSGQQILPPMPPLPVAHSGEERAPEAVNFEKEDGVGKDAGHYDSDRKDLVHQGSFEYVHVADGLQMVSPESGLEALYGPDGRIATPPPPTPPLKEYPQARPNAAQPRPVLFQDIESITSLPSSDERTGAYNTLRASYVEDADELSAWVQHQMQHNGGKELLSTQIVELKPSASIRKPKTSMGIPGGLGDSQARHEKFERLGKGALKVGEMAQGRVGGWMKKVGKKDKGTEREGEKTAAEVYHHQKQGSLASMVSLVSSYAPSERTRRGSETVTPTATIHTTSRPPTSHQLQPVKQEPPMAVQLPPHSPTVNFSSSQQVTPRQEHFPPIHPASAPHVPQSPPVPHIQTQFQQRNLNTPPPNSAASDDTSKQNTPAHLYKHNFDQPAQGQVASNTPPHGPQGQQYPTPPHVRQDSIVSQQSDLQRKQSVASSVSVPSPGPGRSNSMKNQFLNRNGGSPPANTIRPVIAEDDDDDDLYAPPKPRQKLQTPRDPPAPTHPAQFQHPPVPPPQQQFSRGPQGQPQPNPQNIDSSANPPMSAYEEQQRLARRTSDARGSMQGKPNSPTYPNDPSAYPQPARPVLSDSQYGSSDGPAYVPQLQQPSAAANRRQASGIMKAFSSFGSKRSSSNSTHQQPPGSASSNEPPANFGQQKKKRSSFLGLGKKVQRNGSVVQTSSPPPPTSNTPPPPRSSLPPGFQEKPQPESQQLSQKMVKRDSILSRFAKNQEKLGQKNLNSPKEKGNKKGFSVDMFTRAASTSQAGRPPLSSNGSSQQAPVAPAHQYPVSEYVPPEQMNHRSQSVGGRGMGMYQAQQEVYAQQQINHLQQQQQQQQRPVQYHQPPPQGYRPPAADSPPLGPGGIPQQQPVQQQYQQQYRAPGPAAYQQPPSQGYRPPDMNSASIGQGGFQQQPPPQQQQQYQQAPPQQYLSQQPSGTPQQVSANSSVHRLPEQGSQQYTSLHDPRVSSETSRRNSPANVAQPFPAPQQNQYSDPRHGPAGHPALVQSPSPEVPSPHQPTPPSAVSSEGTHTPHPHPTGPRAPPPQHNSTHADSPLPPLPQPQSPLRQQFKYGAPPIITSAPAPAQTHSSPPTSPIHYLQSGAQSTAPKIPPLPRFNNEEELRTPTAPPPPPNFPAMGEKVQAQPPPGRKYTPPPPLQATRDITAGGSFPNTPGSATTPRTIIAGPTTPRALPDAAKPQVKSEVRFAEPGKKEEEPRSFYDNSDSESDVAQEEKISVTQEEMERWREEGEKLKEKNRRMEEERKRKEAGAEKEEEVYVMSATSGPGGGWEPEGWY